MTRLLLMGDGKTKQKEGGGRGQKSGSNGTNRGANNRNQFSRQVRQDARGIVGASLRPWVRQDKSELSIHMKGDELVT